MKNSLDIVNTTDEVLLADYVVVDTNAMMIFNNSGVWINNKGLPEDMRVYNGLVINADRLTCTVAVNRSSNKVKVERKYLYPVIRKGGIYGP